MKPGRQSIILELISEQDIETQFDLMEALAKKGIQTTQATLSRDIRDLRLIKETGPNGRTRYARSKEAETRAEDDRLKRILRDSIQNADLAQNLLVIKTIPGLASGVCSAIDNMKHEGLVGTIAGDDTAFIAFKDNDSAIKFYNLMEGML